jgi:anti-anti-sigma factor
MRENRGRTVSHGFHGSERRTAIFSVSQKCDVSIIQVEDDLDIATSAGLASAIERATRSTLPRIVVSLETCRFCDASGLHVLLEAKTLLGSRLAIVVPPRCSARLIFEITELVNDLSLRDSLDEALEEMGGSA